MLSTAFSTFDLLMTGGLLLFLIAMGASLEVVLGRQRDGALNERRVRGERGDSAASGSVEPLAGAENIADERASVPSPSSAV